MDKMLTIIIIFLAISVFLCRFIIYGSSSKIFQGVDIANQTLVQQYEDKAREKQTQHEDECKSRTGYTNK